jgi:hypothetical protein
MKIGEWVRVIGVPPNLTDDKDMKTRTLFENCLGKAFRIEAIENVEGFPYPLVELHVGHILGKERHTDAIWVEPEYLEPAKPERYEVK